MRKLIVPAFGFFLMTGATAFAQNVVKPATDSTTTITTTLKVVSAKNEIKTSEMPKPIVTIITGLKSQGWKASETSTFTKSVSGKIAFYTVSLKNASIDETKLIDFANDGKILKQ